MLAVLDTFDGHLEPAKFIQKYEEFNKTILQSLDQKFFDICCLDKMLSLCPQISNKLVLVAGTSHAANICKLFEKMGYQTILEEVNEAYIDGTAIFFCSNKLAYFELALYLFFSNGLIPAEILPQLEQATKSAAECFKERLANTIKKNSSLGLTSAPIKQSEPIEPLTSPFKLLEVQGDPIANPSSSCCHNNGCQKKATNTCTRRRQVRYCGKECQVNDWHAKHKSECKPYKTNQYISYAS